MGPKKIFFLPFYGALTKVLDTGPKSKAPRGDHPMVKKSINQDQLRQGCQNVPFVDKIRKLGIFRVFGCQKKKNLDTLKLGYFENMDSLGHFPYFCPIYPC